MKNLTLQQFLKLAAPDDCRIFHTGNDQWEVRCHAGSYAPGVGLVDLLSILAGKGICCSVIEWDGLSKQQPELAARITDEQREEIVTVLQAISGGFSDDPAQDAQTLLSKMTGELPGFGQSFAPNRTAN